MRKTRLLSVDWDYFFPEKSNDPVEWPLYDWGHRDSGAFFLNDVWYHRAVGFVRNNVPLSITTGLEQTFWDRFKFSPNCKLFLSESHQNIFLPAVNMGINIDEIWSYDAHHDAGYRDLTEDEYLAQNRVTCADWVLAYKLGLNINTKVFYPKWRSWALHDEPRPIVKVERRVDDGQPVTPVFDRVFICRSGGWTPPWVDDNFEAFVAACPVKSHVELQPVPNRQFSVDRLNMEVAQSSAMMDIWNTLK